MESVSEHLQSSTGGQAGIERRWVSKHCFAAILLLRAGMDRLHDAKTEWLSWSARIPQRHAHLLDPEAQLSPASCIRPPTVPAQRDKAGWPPRDGWAVSS